MILVIGDIILDEYWKGSSDRLSPEAPVPVVNIQNKHTRLGGAGNVANNIVSLGEKVHLITAFANDQNGKILKENLKKNNINFTNLKIKKKFTNSKIRVISNNNQVVRLDNDKNYTTNSSINIPINLIYKKIDLCKILLISDYNKGIIGNNLKKIIKYANRKKIPVLIDPKTNDIDLYKNCNLITPNLNEFNRLIGKYQNSENFVNKTRKILNKLKIKNLLITLGKKGMHFINSKESIKINSINQEVYDVSGAGDTVIASISIFLNMGKNLIDSINMSNIAAGLVVKKEGTSTVSIHEIYNYNQKKLNLKYLDDRIYIQSIIKSLKKSRKKIVMTNGCFDIVHAGHITLLEKSKNLGDFLIVAINTDKSVRKNKGYSRPINTIYDRIKVLKSLSCIDMIISFDSITPIKLYKSILPDILTKGEDYKLKDIVGAREIQSNGGTIKRIKIYKNLSTTRIIKNS